MPAESNEKNPLRAAILSAIWRLPNDPSLPASSGGSRSTIPSRRLLDLQGRCRAVAVRQDRNWQAAANSRRQEWRLVLSIVRGGVDEARSADCRRECC